MTTQQIYSPIFLLIPNEFSSLTDINNEQYQVLNRRLNNQS